MAQNQPEPNQADETGRVVHFRQRPLVVPPARLHPASVPHGNETDDDFAQYEQDEAIDYRQRMLMNVNALVIVALLVGAGVWIADTITQMQRDQDCVLQGRKNCTPIQVPASREQ